MKIFWTVITTIFVIFVIGFLVIYSGMINVSAREPVGGVTKWVLTTTMESSVSTRADEIEIPDLLNDEMIKTGAEHYISMCENCHGAPGKEISELAKGLEPKAPHLYDKEEAEEWNDAEEFWITKNGIQMTGMPAWGETHSDDDIWAIVAFLNKLPELSVDEYHGLTTVDEQYKQDTTETNSDKEHSH